MRSEFFLFVYFYFSTYLSQTVYLPLFSSMTCCECILKTSSLWDYTEGHPLHSAIPKPGRGTALIGPEIAKETRLDLEGQGKEEEEG